MKSKFPITLIFLILSANGCVKTKHQYADAIDSIFVNYSGDQSPGASVCVIKNGKIDFSGSYGMADLQKGVKVEPETNFRLASVTKQFTAMSVLILADRGLLNLQQSLTDIWPDFPAYGEKINIKQLLQHTSGLIDYESLIPDTATAQVHDQDVLDMMRSVDSTYFEPGTQFSYDNSGYAVLSMIVEKISGKRFEEFLQTEIFVPVGMKNSVAYKKGYNQVENRAMGYADSDGEFILRDQSVTSAVLGDGGIYSSILDLYKWDQLLYGNYLISDGLQELAFTPELLVNGDSTDYGLGWRIDTFSGYKRIHHTGSSCGFRNVIQRFPEIKLTIIILTNRDEPDVTQFADKIAKIYGVGKLN